MPAQTPGIGDWFSLETGPLAGRLMCATLEELQKADIGRKYARKDKRPLDPPPVAVMRLFQVAHAGTPHEHVQEFVDLDEPLAFGFTCHVDLFPVAGEPSASAAPIRGDSTSRAASSSSPTHPLAFRPSSIPSYHALPPARPSATPASHGVTDSRPSSHFPRDSFHRSSTDDQDVPRLVYGPAPQLSCTQPQDEEDCTMLLAGEAVVLCSLVDNDGQRTAMFIFSDLAVRKEGLYRLRYRVFNIFGHHQDQNRPVIPVLAECYGGTFEVFSTKTFPGLQISTDLTKKISLSGVRVNSRQRERKGWKKARRSTSSGERSPQRARRESTPVCHASGSGHQSGPWLPALPVSVASLPHRPALSPSPQAEFTFSHSHRIPGPSALFAVHQTPTPTPTPMAGPDSARDVFGLWAKSGVADSDIAMGDGEAGTRLGGGNRSLGACWLHHP
ncbi:velvet factor-domain-containing protein [Earliella scabrosa]|nr:velvet factor-domain-containing protein [Earliella scabrosa]